MKKTTVQKLKDRYDQAREERLAKKAAEQPFKDRVAGIFEAPKFVNTDFWCPVCSKDCTGTGFRQVCVLRETVPTAWYVGYCPNGHKMIRRITDKDSDPYYYRSLMLARQRHDLRDALLTPDDPRFRILYPKQYAELYGQKTGN